jgi:hypothetical protein
MGKSYLITKTTTVTNDVIIHEDIFVTAPCALIVFVMQERN